MVINGNSKTNGLTVIPYIYHWDLALQILYGLQIFAEISKSHVALLQEGVVESERGAHALGLVSHGRNVLQVIAQQRSVVGMGAMLDDFMSPAHGSFAAKVGHALLGDDDVHVVLRAVYMATHRYDGRYLSVLGSRRRIENADGAVALIVAGTADAVHQLRPADMTGVLVAIEVDLQGRVHGDHPEAANQFGRIGQFTRAQRQVFGKEVHILIDVLNHLVGTRHSGAAGLCYFPFFNQVDNGILHHLGEHFHGRKSLAESDGFHDCIACGAHTTLNREHARRNMARFHVAQEEVHHVLTDSLGLRSELFEGTRLFGDIALHDAHNLLGVDGDITLADAVTHMQHRNGFTMWIFLAFVDVVQLFRHRTVEVVPLYHDMFGQAHDGRHDAAGRGQVSLTLVGTLLQVGYLDESPVDRTIVTAAQTLGNMSEMHVLIVDFSQIGMYAEILIGREGSTKLDGVYVGQITLQALTARSTGD